MYQGRYPDAIVAYRNAIELTPKDGWLHKNLGDALVKQGQYPDAIAAYREAISHGPKGIEQVHRALANALFFDVRYEEAWKEFETAARVAPGDAWVYIDWGRALKCSWDLRGAEEKFRKAKDLEPKNDSALKNLAIAISLRDPVADEANKMFADAANYGSGDAFLYKDWGTALARAGDLDAAAKKFEKALELANRGTSSVCWKSVARLFEPRANKSSSWIYQEWADALNDAGRRCDAAKKLSQAIEANPANEEADQRRQQICETLATAPPCTACPRG